MPVQQVISDLLKAEIAENSTRSIKDQMTASRLPLAKEIDTFEFVGAPINDGRARSCHRRVPRRQCIVVLFGGTGFGKTHLSIDIARNCVRNSSRVRFYTTTDLVNRLELASPRARPGRKAC